MLVIASLFILLECKLTHWINRSFKTKNKNSTLIDSLHIHSIQIFFVRFVYEKNEKYNINNYRLLAKQNWSKLKSVMLFCVSKVNQVFSNMHQHIFEHPKMFIISSNVSKYIQSRLNVHSPIIKSIQMRHPFFTKILKIKLSNARFRIAVNVSN